MANPSGYATQAAVKLAQAWGNTWSAAVDTLVPYVSDSLTRAYDELRSQALIGQAAQHPSAHGTEMVSGDLVLELTYGVATELLGYGFGAQATGAITLANDLSSKTFNLEIDKIESRYRFYACMVNSISISAAAGDGGPVQVTLGIIAQRGDIVATAFPSLSLPTDGTEKRVFFEHLRSGGALFADTADAIASGDAIGISSVEFTVENNLKADDKDSTEAYVIQPIRDDFRAVTLKAGLARYDSTSKNFQTWRDGDTNVQAELTFTHPTTAETVKLEVPFAKVAEGANFPIGGPGVISDEATLKAYYNGSGGGAVNSTMAVVDQAALTFSAV